MPEPATPGLRELGAIATREEFGRALTRLKDAKGVAIREVAKRTGAPGEPGIPLASLGDYFAGKHLPNGPALTKLLRACEVSEPALVAAWQEARLRARLRPGRLAGEPVPYRGLAFFRSQDAAWFFGREELTALLVRRARQCRAAGRPLVVVGPSGAGKSSLLRAGLIPAPAPDDGSAANGAGLQDATGVQPFTPGADPCGELARRLDEGAPAIIVDQFEEIFGPGVAETSRQAFIDALGQAARSRADGAGAPETAGADACVPGTLVVLGLRADFYPQALRYPLLADALQDGQVVVGPMSEAELRRAIVEPARLAKTSVDEALVELLLGALRPTASQQALDAGALPLLSYALLATWDRHRSGRLTVADYLATGGIGDAVKKAADDAFGELGELGESGRRAARRLFLRLVWVAEDAPDTRRRLPLAELADAPGEQAVLGTFVAHRLLTVGDSTVEIAHEALLTAWPELRSWIDSSRADLLIRRRVTEAARDWAARGRDPGDLLRGGKLAMARSLATDPAKRAELTGAERDLLDASLAAERAERQAERRTARRMRNLAACLTAALVLAGVLTGAAFDQRAAATAQRAAATAQRDLATSRQIATEVEQLRGQVPSLAAQLSVAAYREAQTPQARGALLESSGAPMPARLIGPAGIVQAVALSPDHRLLAAVDDDGGVWLWRLDSGADPPRAREIARLGAAAFAAAFSPDGTILAVAGGGAKVYLFSLADPARPARAGTLAGPANTIYSLAFSPGGSTLAAGSADGNVWLWNLALPHAAGRALKAGSGYVQSVTFGAGGGILAAGTAGGTVRLWDTANLARPKPIGRPLTGPAGAVYSVAISPDGAVLAAGSRDGDVYLWSLPRRTFLGRLTGATSWVNAVAFGPDGTTLAAGGSDDTVRLWDLATRTVTAQFAHPGPVTTLTWDGGGTLITGAADGEVRLWRVPSPVLPAGSVVNGVAFSPRGDMLAVASDGLRLWDPATDEPLGAMQTVSGAVPEAVAFGPDRPTIATGNSDGTVRLWTYDSHGALAPSGTPLRGAAPGEVESVTFSPDGRLLASGGDDGTVRLWDVAGPPRRLAVLPAFGAQVFTVAFSPDGRLLAAGSASDTVRLWSLADPARPVPLATLTGPASTVYSVAFSPDGRLLAAGSADRSVYLWNVADARHPVRDRPALTGPASYVYTIAFSPDGRTLAAGSTDDTVWLWTVSRTPALYATLTGPTSYVYTVAFSRDGRTIAAGSADGTVRLWDTSPAAAAAGVCAAVGDPITSQEWNRYVPGVPFIRPCG